MTAGVLLHRVNSFRIGQRKTCIIIFYSKKKKMLKIKTCKKTEHAATIIRSQASEFRWSFEA